MPRTILIALAFGGLLAAPALAQTAPAPAPAVTPAPEDARTQTPAPETVTPVRKGCGRDRQVMS
jgi:hypothetical protein